jgi:hypothetical protein
MKLIRIEIRITVVIIMWFVGMFVEEEPPEPVRLTHSSPSRLRRNPFRH